MSPSYQSKVVAVQELDRLLSSNKHLQTPWDYNVRRNAAEKGYYQFRQRFEPMLRDDATLGIAMIRYANELHGIIRRYREETCSRDAYLPVSRSMDETEIAARMSMDTIRTSSVKNLRVMCRAGGWSVRKHHASTEVIVGPMWRKNILAHGIDKVEWQGKQSFIVTAKPKTSAFLADEGISVWDAYAYTPSGHAPHGEGYVFKSTSDTRDFAVFHTDFMKGVTLIRRRVRAAVLKAMGIE